MNILHVVHGYHPAMGGAERLMQGVSENLASRYGDRVTVFTTNGYNAEAFVDPGQPLLPTAEFDLNGVRVRRFRVFNRLGPLLYHLQRLVYALRLPGNEHLRTWYTGPIVPGLEQRVEAFPADVVAASAFPLLHMFTVLKACRRSRKRLVFVGALHPLDKWGFQRSMIHRAIERADAYIALSSFEKRYLLEEWRIPEEKIAVIGVGIDPAPFERAKGDVIRSRYSIGERPLVAYIGQQVLHKGIHNLILSMKMVWQERPDVRLLLAGARTNTTPYFEHLIESHLTPRERARIVYLHGFSEDEKPALFAACDVFAYPSSYESFGIAFLEAWAAGKPVVGCRAGAVASVVAEGSDGLLVPVDDPLTLGIALLRLLSSDGLRRRLATAGREKVRQRYCWEVVSQRWRQVYERLLRG
jgi:glycosyltransferase involved in cell wall biosynthesis